MAPIVIVDQLREAESTGHTRRSAAHDDDIGGHLGVVDVGERFAKDEHFGLSSYSERPNFFETVREERGTTQLDILS